MIGLRVSGNGRFLEREDGEPFFYLGDTAWELFHRLTPDEAAFYLQTRARQGFNVIQAVVLAELDGLTVPNRNGDLPLHDLDPSRPNEAYFEHVDRVIETANSLGLVVGLLPTWGDKVNRKWGGGPEIFTPANAQAYGELLGRRYRDADLIWILGGDRPVEAPVHLEIWRAMALGLALGDGGRHLKTYHPMGYQSSTQNVGGEEWIDFHMIQSGHGGPVVDNHRLLGLDYGREPVKPCMDAEPNYEDHPIDWKPEALGWFSEVEVRRAAYWAVFSGACGHTYGCHDIWQFWEPGREPVAWARTPWREALSLPGASQMRILKELVLSRSVLAGVPDQSVILSPNPAGAEYAAAIRGEDWSWLMVYCPTQQPLALDLSRFASGRAAWFDPRTGAVVEALDVEGAFTPPTAEDWVLVLG